jgi:chromosome segregation ATPase
MISINLWSKATELGSKLKDSFQLSSSEKPLVEKDVYDSLKKENENLKKDFDEINEKYNNIIKEINNKNEKEENLSENEYKEKLNSIIDKFRKYIINLFGGENNDEINLLFINPHNEEFDKKINEYNKNKLENILIKNFISDNNEIITSLLKDNNKEEKLDENEKNQENEIINNNDININQILNFIDLKKLLCKLDEEKNNYIKELKCLNEKVVSNNQQMQTMKETIEQFQKDFKEIKIKEDTLNESILKKEKEISEKEIKYNELKNILEENNNNIKEKEININSYKINIEQMNIKIKELTEKLYISEKMRNKYDEEIKNLNIKVKSYKDDMELLQVHSDEINTKNIQITELLKQVESLKSSYKILEDSKIEFVKEKNEEIDIYKNKILELTQQLNEEKQKLQNFKKNEEIENIYIQKISDLEKQNNLLEDNIIQIKKNNEDMKKELNETKNKMMKDLRDNEFMIDKRVLSSVLVNYFDVNASDNTKKNLLETLSSIMEYSNEDRQKMGLKPIHIGENNNSNKGALKSMSEGLYNFILNS